jgi:hypothetical protein
MVVATFIHATTAFSSLKARGTPEDPSLPEGTCHRSNVLFRLFDANTLVLPAGTTG